MKSRSKQLDLRKKVFFEHIPHNQVPAASLVDDVDAIIREIWKQQEDPQGLSMSLQRLAVKNAGLGNLLIEALDLDRQAETAYKYNVEKTKLKLIGEGTSATAAESEAKVLHKDKLDEWNELQKNVDVLKIKRGDVGRVIDAVRTRISLIKIELN